MRLAVTHNDPVAFMVEGFGGRVSMQCASSLRSERNRFAVFPDE